MQSNKAAVRALVADAQPIPARRFEEDPEPGQRRGDVAPGQWTPDALGLPPDCPVTPLGVEGEICWFLDPIGQLCAYTKPFGQADTLLLFKGRPLYLYWAWPKFSKDLNVDGWRNEKAREALISAATAKGTWKPADKVRGRGCWVGAGGELIVHTGREIYVGSADRTRAQPPGEMGTYVYPTRPPIQRPWSQPVTAAENPVRLLRPVLDSWSWSRPQVDPHLLLGWIGSAFLGGALPWRSNIYITGDAGSGKSTLQDILKGLLGDWLIETTNTTAAGIYQYVGQDSLPVAVDEFEGKAENARAVAVLELARQAASGGRGLRGGDKHTGHEFLIRSSFIFSSINTPPLKPQDVSRFALLKLHQLRAGLKPPELSRGTLQMMGEQILRRLIEEWPRMQVTWDAFREAMRAGGMDARGQDQFGTLLALADLIEHRGWDESRLRVAVDGELVAWADLMQAAGLAEFEDRTSNWRGCLSHMLSVPVEAWRNGGRVTVGQVLEAWVGDHDDFNNDIAKVRGLLSQAGLGLKRLARKDDWLVVPNTSPLVRRLFEGSQWAGDQTSGVWAGALRQGPRDEIWQTCNERVNGVRLRGTMIRLAGLYGPDGIMAEPQGSPGGATPPPRPVGCQE